MRKGASAFDACPFLFLPFLLSAVVCFPSSLLLIHPYAMRHHQLFQAAAVIQRRPWPKSVHAVTSSVGRVYVRRPGIPPICAAVR